MILNPKQQEAARHLNGPMLISAGPGTGKTHTLVARLHYLVTEHGTDPGAILAVTFTNAAADHLKLRINKLRIKNSGIKHSMPYVSTLHALCYDLLTSARGPARVMSRTEQEAVLKEVLKSIGAGRAHDVRDILQRLSIVKNQPTLDFHWPSIDGVPSAKALFEAYNKGLAEAGGVDFDDLIRQSYFLLKEDGDLLAATQERFRYLLVDEYQDLNAMQVALIDLLASGHRNLWVIGDPDQTIYGWRGSDPNTMVMFKERYPEAKIVILKENYRNPARILRAASAVIQNNQERLPGIPKAVRQGGELHLWTMEDEVTGKWALVQVLEKLLGSTSSMSAADRMEPEQGTEGLHFEDIAILFRRRREGELLKSYLEEKGFPVYLSCEKDRYEQPPLNAFLALSHLLLYPEEGEWLYRFLLALPGFPDVYAEEWYRESKRGNTLLHHVIVARSQTGMPPGVQELWNKVLTFLEAAEKQLEGDFQAFWAFLSAAFLPLLDLTSRDLNRLDAFLPVVQALYALPARAGLRHLTARADTEHEEEPALPAGKIQLLTLHAAKGLEFRTVLLFGLEDGVLPAARAETPRELEEERRLFYVGLTRAIDTLHLITLKKRKNKGAEPSRFLAELPNELLASRGLSARNEKRKKHRDATIAQMSLF